MVGSCPPICEARWGLSNRFQVSRCGVAQLHAQGVDSSRFVVHIVLHLQDTRLQASHAVNVPMGCDVPKFAAFLLHNLGA